jgi:hypothetical protein
MMDQARDASQLTLNSNVKPEEPPQLPPILQLQYGGHHRKSIFFHSTP